VKPITSARSRAQQAAGAATFALLVLAVAPVGARAAPVTPLESAASNYCDDLAKASQGPTPPAIRPVASLVLHNGTSTTSPPIADGAVLTAPAVALHEGKATFHTGLTVRPTQGYCAWHGDVNSRYHFQPRATETHEYRTPGFYKPWMYVVDSTGVWSQKAFGPTFQVNAPPSASFRFSPTAPKPGDRVTFTSTSSDHEQTKYGEAVSHAWDLDGDGFDDGAASTASFTYPSARSWTARLRVTDSNGVRAEATASVPVVAPATTNSPRPRRPGTSTQSGPDIPSTVTGDESGMVSAVGEQGQTKVFLAPRVLAKFRVRRGRTRVRMLALRSLVKGSTVLVRCRGRGCPRRAQSVAVRAKKGLRFRRFERSLRTGAVLEVRVTMPGTVGRYVRMRMRRGEQPVRRELCVQDGAKRPGDC